MTAKRSPRQSSLPLPALHAYQRDMHAAHRNMTRAIRQFIRQMEEQMADLRHQLDKDIEAQRARALRGAEGDLPTEARGHRSPPSVHDRTKLEIS